MLSYMNINMNNVINDVGLNAKDVVNKYGINSPKARPPISGMARRSSIYGADWCG